MLIGIDLGTTFSAVATVNKEGKAEVITNRDGERTTPSVVMFEDGVVVVGEQAKENSIVDPYNVCQLVKRQIGRKNFSFELSMDEKYTAEEISAMILKRLKEDAEAATGESVEGAVITVPAYFEDAQRKATQDAGKIAGLNVIGIINEPTAAAIAYCHGQVNTDGNIMVYDLGGGTFDITIMRLSNNLEKVDILATNGNRSLGGFDFDNVIISKVNKIFSQKHGIDLEDDDIAYQELRLKAEKAKKALSNRPKADISISSQGKVEKIEITREEFSSMIQGYLESTKACMEIAMDEAKLKWADISKILLVGGSTRVPAVQNMIREFSGIEPSHELNPDEAVAIGAAYYADLLGSKSSGKDPQAKKAIKVTDVNSHSLGVLSRNVEKDLELIAVFLIPRGTPLPASGEETFYLLYDGQTELVVHVVEGEDEDPEFDTIIGTTTLRLEDSLPAGAPICVSMHYDINGIIHVTVRDITNNKDLGEFHIEREANLNEEDVQEKKKFLDDIKLM